MAPLARNGVSALDDPPIDHNSAADPGAKNDTKYDASAFSRAIHCF